MSGKPNGSNGRANGRPNGSANGKVNGMANGHKPASNGRGNGAKPINLSLLESRMIEIEQARTDWAINNPHLGTFWSALIGAKVHVSHESF